MGDNQPAKRMRIVESTIFKPQTVSELKQFFEDNKEKGILCFNKRISQK